MRLPRKCSITRRADFIRVRKDGRAKTGRFLILSTLEDASLPHLMATVITTRKVGKAHERNRMRRRLRAILQRHGHRLLDPHRFLIAIPRPGSTKAAFADLEIDWLNQMRRLGLLEKPSNPKSQGSDSKSQTPKSK